MTSYAQAADSPLSILPVGKYKARAVRARLEQSERTGTEWARITFVVALGNFEYEVDWLAFLSAKGIERTIASIALLGYAGEDLFEFLEGLPQTAPNEVNITVEHNEFQGDVSARIKWINPLPRDVTPDAKKDLREVCRAHFRAMKTQAPGGQATPVASPQKHRTLEVRNLRRLGEGSSEAFGATGSDDDIPFLTRPCSWVSYTPAA